MIYLEFNTEAEASQAEQRILVEGSKPLKARLGLRVNSEGVVDTALKNGKQVEAVTTNWSIPKQALNGKWYIKAPTAIEGADALLEGLENPLADESPENPIVTKTGKEWLQHAFAAYGITWTEIEDPDFGAVEGPPDV